MKKIHSILFFLLLFIMAGVFIYNENFSEDAVKERIINQEGYIIKLQKESVPTEFFIKPEWISFTSEEPQTIDQVVFKDDQTNVVLMEVWNRGNDIYFSFGSEYKLDRQSGDLLVNYIISPDGFSSTSGMNDVLLFDVNHNEIPHGQWGSGPAEQFGFGVNPEQYDAIKEGFFVQYYLYNKYSYKKE